MCEILNPTEESSNLSCQSSRTSPLSRTKFFEKSYRYKDEQARRRRKKKGGAELAGTGESLRASKSMGSRPERDNDVEHELEGPAAGTRRKASTRRSARGSSPSRAHPSDTTTSHPSQPGTYSIPGVTIVGNQFLFFQMKRLKSL